MTFNASRKKLPNDSITISRATFDMPHATYYISHKIDSILMNKDISRSVTVQRTTTLQNCAERDALVGFMSTSNRIVPFSDRLLGPKRRRPKVRNGYETNERLRLRKFFTTTD